MDQINKEGLSLEESLENDPEVAMQETDFVKYEIISELGISAWENFYHARREGADKDPTHPGVALVTLNRKKYIEKFKRLIEKEGKWEDDDDIPKMAEKEFDKINQEFGRRYKGVMDIALHPCLPKVCLVEQDRINKLCFAELEYVSGAPFLNTVLSPFQILGLAKNLLEGLEHMHDHGLLHRRIKSENIYIHFEGSKPVVKFTSWGIAVPIDKAQGDRSGSKHYVAPEVLAKGKVNVQADLWAVGSLLYQALTGEYPFPEREEAQNLPQLLNCTKNEKMPNELKVYEHFRNLSQNEAKELNVDKLQELVSELLKPDPEQRAFKTARKVIAFIELNWPKVMWGAPDTKEMLTFTTSR